MSQDEPQDYMLVFSIQKHYCIKFVTLTFFKYRIVHEDRRPAATQFVAPKITGFSSSFSQPEDSFFSSNTRQAMEDSGSSWNFSGPQNRLSVNSPQGFNRSRLFSPDLPSRALSPEQSRQPINQRFSPDRQRRYSPDRSGEDY